MRYIIVRQRKEIGIDGYVYKMYSVSENGVRTFMRNIP